jgi:signal recognition particle subunit SEC65
MDAIIEKYGFKEGLTTKGNKILKWPYEGIRKPTEAAVAKIVADYEIKFAYRKERKYPPIEEQLDMIHHDKMNGTNKWCELICSIKSKHPKV